MVLKGNVFKTLAKIICNTIRINSSSSATDAAIHEKVFESGTTTLIISNKEMNDINKIVKSLEESGLLIKDVNNNVTYFDRFEVKHIPKEIKKPIGNKNITTNVFVIQAYNSVLYGYIFIGFIDFLLEDKSLLH